MPRPANLPSQPLYGNPYSLRLIPLASALPIPPGAHRPRPSPCSPTGPEERIGLSSTRRPGAVGVERGSIPRRGEKVLYDDFVRCCNGPR